VTRLRPLSESECYTRLYGDRDSTVSVIREAELERPSGGLLGEQLLKLFEKHQLEGWPDEVPGVEAA
jgi:biotin synthase-like enzyme